MRKIYILAIALISFANTFAAGCTIDSNSVGFISPRPSFLPCVERGVPYNQVIQVSVPSSIDLKTLYPALPISFNLYIDSVEIDSVNGLPNGLSYTVVPVNQKLYGGQRGCINVTGTTNDPTGIYNINFFGRLTAHGTPFLTYFDGDTTIDLATLQSNPNNPFKMFLEIIEPGTPCTHVEIAAGVNDNFSKDLNSAFSVYPNPSTGVFQFNLNAGHRVNGEINVLDVTGRQVFNQKLDIIGLYNTTIDLSGYAKGLYTLQLKTAEGVASKNIQVQ